MKKIFILYLLNEKAEFILCSETKCPKSGIFTTGWGESGKVILHVSIAVFFGRCQKKFQSNMVQPPMDVNQRIQQNNSEQMLPAEDF